MYCFMINKGSIGPYKNAFGRTRSAFENRDPQEMADLACARYKVEQRCIIIESLGMDLSVSHPEGEVFFSQTNISPLWQWQLITLNHLVRTDGRQPTGNLASFRDLDGGRAFHRAFYRNTISQLSEITECISMQQIKRAGKAFGGTEVYPIGDLSLTFYVFPLYPVTIIIWRGDEQMRTSANILFDSSANSHLHTEDASAAGGLVSGFLRQQMDL